jgi:hypothetical protein
MSNTQAHSSIHLAILDRVTKAGLNVPQYKALLALSANTGRCVSGDIARSTGTAFNWYVVSAMHDSKMIERERTANGGSVAYLYNITKYGERVLDYITSGKGDV